MATVTLEAINNSHMDGNLPTSAWEDGTFWPTGYFPTPQTNRALLLFDVTSLGVGWAINSATLKLTVDSNFLGTSHTLNVYRLKRKWYAGNSDSPWRVNTRASWNNYVQGGGLPWTTAGAADTTDDRDATPIGSLAVTSATSGTKSITLDPTLVQAWVSGAQPNHGLLLQASNEAAPTLMRWKGLSDATPANRPQLVIDYTPTPGVTLLTNLEAYWTLDTSGYTDSSGRGHTLTPTNGPTQATGLLGNAAHFVVSSAQYLSCSDAALKPAGTTDWTFTCWVKLTDKLNFYNIAGQRGGDDLGWLLWYHKQSVLDYFVFQYNNSDTDPTIVDTIGFASGHPSAGVWTFVACRHDSVRKFGQLFVNNARSCSGSHVGSEQSYCSYLGLGSTPQASAADFTIGRTMQTTYYHNGDVDEVGFWTRWLSDAEILSLYNGGAGLAYPFGVSTASFRRTLAEAGSRVGTRQRM